MRRCEKEKPSGESESRRLLVMTGLLRSIEVSCDAILISLGWSSGGRRRRSSAVVFSDTKRSSNWLSEGVSGWASGTLGSMWETDEYGRGEWRRAWRRESIWGRTTLFKLEMTIHDVTDRKREKKNDQLKLMRRIVKSIKNQCRKGDFNKSKTNKHKLGLNYWLNFFHISVQYIEYSRGRKVKK